MAGKFGDTAWINACSRYLAEKITNDDFIGFLSEKGFLYEIATKIPEDILNHHFKKELFRFDHKKTSINIKKDSNINNLFLLPLELK